MEHTTQDIQQLLREFQECRTLFTALGTRPRQYLVCILLNCGCGGIRVAQLAERTNLSRPAISHHIQILKRAGIVASRREGTQSTTAWPRRAIWWRRPSGLFSHIQEVMASVPDRGASGRFVTREVICTMELLEAMEQRHSVRSYEDRPLEPEVRAELTDFLAQCSQESGLHMQLGPGTSRRDSGASWPTTENFPG